VKEYTKYLLTIPATPVLSLPRQHRHWPRLHADRIRHFWPAPTIRRLDIDCREVPRKDDTTATFSLQLERAKWAENQVRLHAHLM
jgi:hypothetical protein